MARTGFAPSKASIEKQITIRKKIMRSPSPDVDPTIEREGHFEAEMREIISELEQRRQKLAKEYKKFMSQFDVVEPYYSHEKMAQLVKIQISQDEERKHQQRIKIPKHLRIWDSLDWEAAEEKLPLFKFGIIKRVEDKESMLREEIKSFADFNSQSEFVEPIKQGLIAAIKIAADEYGECCNAVIKKINEKDTISQCFTAGKLFANFAPITYTTEYDDDGEFVPQFISEVSTYSPVAILQLLKESIKNLWAEDPRRENKQIQVAIDILFNQIKKQKSISALFKFEKNDIAFAEEKVAEQLVDFERLAQKQRNIKMKYAPQWIARSIDESVSPALSENEELKSVNRLANKIKALTDVLERLHPEHNTLYDMLRSRINAAYIDLQFETKKAIKSLEISAARLVEELTKDRDSKELEPSTVCYKAYISYKAKLDVANHLSESIHQEKNDFIEKYEELKQDFDGFGIDKEIKDTKALFNKFRQEISSACKLANLRATKVDDGAVKLLEEKFEKERLLREALKFLKEQVFNDENIKNFWQNQTTNYYVFCWAGYKVRVQDNNMQGYSHVRVPEGVGKMKDTLKNLNIDDLSYEQIEQVLFGTGAQQIKGIIDERKKHSAGRKPSTIALLAALDEFTKDGTENLEQKFHDFKARILNIVDIKHPLHARLHIASAVELPVAKKEFDLSLLQPRM